MSISNYFETVLLGQLPSPVFVKLHLGAPGETGTSNPAAETTRVSVTLAAASGSNRATNASAVWTSVSATETVSHISVWDNISAGNCLWTGALTTPRALTAGDNLTIASGALIFSLD